MTFIFTRSAQLFILLTLCFIFSSCDNHKTVREIDVKIEATHVEVKNNDEMKGLPEGTNMILGLVVPTSSSQWFVKVAAHSSEFNDIKPIFR
jgi:hypothetical protein